jgi:hypothetical protein
MSIALCVRDETTTGVATGELVIEFLTEHITVQELIRSRVYQEVQDFNLRKPAVFRGLVQPTDTEAELNGYKFREARQVSWQRQFETALQSFKRRQFLILVDDRQMIDLDEQIVIGPDTRVSFLKLVPLVAG